MKGKTLLLGLSFIIPFFGLSQEYKKMISKEDKTLKEISQSAELYFSTREKGRGTGYKQFKRWEYNAIRTQDENGFVKSSYSYVKELEKYNKEVNSEIAKSAQTAGNWSMLGPTNWTATTGFNPGIGRVTSISVDKTNNNHIIIGAETGGVWKTINGGTTWVSLTDNFSNMTVRSLVIAPTSSSTYYWGGGNGEIYKSIDSGATWSLLATIGGEKVNKILLHPSDPQKIFCTIEDSGIYKSLNGGVNWVKVTTDFDGYDVEFNPGNSNIIYATGADFHRSIDGGVTWTTITNVVNSSDEKMIGVSGASNSNIVYVVGAAGTGFGGFYVSVDNGMTFTEKSHPNKNYFGYETDASDLGDGQATDNMAITVSPTNANEVYLAGINVWRSLDGGTTFSPASAWKLSDAVDQNLGYCHADVEILEYVGSTLYTGTDGGVFKAITPNGAISNNYFTDLSTGLGIQQFYRFGISQADPVVISGGSQDNGTSTYTPTGIWKNWLGADGMESFVDKNNSNIIYGTTQNGGLAKSLDGGDTDTGIISQPVATEGNWVTPFEQDPIVTNTIYTGFKKVHKSLNGGETWTAISQDFGADLNQLKIAPSNNQIMYAAFNNKLYKTTTGSGTWSELTGFLGNINSIAIHPIDPNKVAIATTGIEKVYVSTNGGATWSSYKKNLPAFAALALVWQNNTNSGLYLGMNYGVYYIENGMTNWESYSNLLPNVMISELEINTVEGKLYAATYGRGVWKSVLYSEVLSVDDVVDLNSIIVYPNPVSSVLNIKWNLNDKTEVRLFNMTGQLVHYSKDTGLNDYQINTSNLAKGIYFLRINSSKGELTKKVMVN